MPVDLHFSKTTDVFAYSSLDKDEKYVFTITKGGKPARYIDAKNISSITQYLGTVYSAPVIYQWLAHKRLFVDSTPNGGTVYTLSIEHANELNDLITNMFNSITVSVEEDISNLVGRAYEWHENTKTRFYEEAQEVQELLQKVLSDNETSSTYAIHAVAQK
jgi:hypothetical protein